MINVAREAMIAIGCIQAQRCHTNHCPTGVATYNRWLAGGFDPNLKSVRVANYYSGLAERFALSGACVRRSLSRLGSFRSAGVSRRPVRCEDGRRSVRTSCNMADERTSVDAAP